MTETEWFACDSPELMLDALRTTATDRKLRLYACACARNIWDLLPEGLPRGLVELAELFADGLCDSGQVAAAADALMANTTNGFPTYPESVALEAAHVCIQPNAPEVCVQPNVWAFARGAGGTARECRANLAFRKIARTKKKGCIDRGNQVASEIDREELARQCLLVRDIFDNPFRPTAIDPRWRTSDVTALARGIYEDWAFDRLPLLADALMDAGCDNEDLLAHCRSDGPHVRGCWVVDAVLDKR